MPRDGLELNFAPLAMISGGETLKMRRAVLEVLSRTGVSVEDPEILKIMASAGCRVEGGRVLVPEEAALAGLDAAPSGYFLRARDGAQDLHVESGGRTYFMASSGTGLVDPRSGRTREPSRREFYEAVRALDYLEHVDLQTAFPFFGFAGVPAQMRVIESAAAKFRLSGKVQKEGSTVDQYRFITAMAQAIGCDVLQIANSASPLAFPKSFTDRLRFLAENDMPVQLAPGPAKGLQAPVTVAGSIAVNHAETIAALVLAQIIRPGARVLAVNMSLTPNMRNCSPAFGDVGNSLQDAVFNQLWRSFRVPCATSCTSWTNAMTLDYQAGYELSMSALIAALTKPSFIAVFSSLSAQTAAHPAKAVIDNDVVGWIKRFCRGVEISDETLALDLINDRSRSSGDFLKTPHTLKRWRDDCFLPEAANWKTGARWFRDGSKGTLELALEKLETISAEHRPSALTAAQESALEDILNEARDYYRKTGLISAEEWTRYQEDLNSPDYPYA